jgi:hypothetical protein
LGRCERDSGVGAFVGATNGGGAGNFGTVAASVLAAAGGRDGGRGGAGRLRLGGAESGRPRTGGGGGRLRTGAPSDDLGDEGGAGATFGVEGVCADDAFDGFTGAALVVGDEGDLVSRGRGGTEGGTDDRPDAGLGGEGFLEWFASSAMVHELTPSLKRAD